MLKTIIMTYKYRHEIDKQVSKGSDFVNHIYVPQLDSTTGAYFHDREDHAHLLKHIEARFQDFVYL